MTAHLAQPLLNVREAAAVLRISMRTVYELIEGGRLPAFRVGGQLRLSTSALESWLAENSTRAGGG